MENKLTLEHLAAYLPYGLNMTFNLPNNPNQTGKLLSSGTTLDGYLTAYVQLSDTEARQIRFSKSSKDSLCNPILRPMGDLYKWMPETENSYYGQAKEETGFDLDTDFSFDVDIEYSGTRRFALLPILSAINFLLKHHFDIFGLIDAGLAIDINTLQK